MRRILLYPWSVLRLFSHVNLISNVEFLGLKLICTGCTSLLTVSIEFWMERIFGNFCRENVVLLDFCSVVFGFLLMQCLGIEFQCFVQ